MKPELRLWRAHSRMTLSYVSVNCQKLKPQIHTDKCRFNPIGAAMFPTQPSLNKSPKHLPSHHFTHHRFHQSGAVFLLTRQLCFQFIAPCHELVYYGNDAALFNEKAHLKFRTTTTQVFYFSDRIYRI